MLAWVAPPHCPQATVGTQMPQLKGQTLSQAHHCTASLATGIRLVALPTALRHQPAGHAKATQDAEGRPPAGCCLPGKPACLLQQPALLPHLHPCACIGALCPSLNPVRACQQLLVQLLVGFSWGHLVGGGYLDQPAGAHLKQLPGNLPQQPVLAGQQHLPRAEPLGH